MLYIDECTNPIGMDAAVKDADFEEQLETAIIETTEALFIRRGMDNYVCQGRR